MAYGFGWLIVILSWLLFMSRVGQFIEIQSGVESTLIQRVSVLGLLGLSGIGFFYGLFVLGYGIGRL